MPGAALFKPAWCAALALTLACGGEPPPRRVAPQAPLSALEEAIAAGDAYPLASGAAYLYLESGHVFYVRNGAAAEVRGLPADSFGTLTPLADGTALLALRAATPPSLFWLKESQATQVREGSVEAALNAPAGDSFYFAESARLRRERDEAREEARIGDPYSDESYPEEEPGF